MSSTFCITGESLLDCKEFKLDEFPTEKDIIVLLLEYFKVGIPFILKNKKDYYNQPVIIDPNDIDLVLRKDYGKYVVVLSIVDDNSTYVDDGFYIEETEYTFQLDLQVIATDVLESIENLMLLKNAVKTLLVNMDYNLKIITNVGNFSWSQFGRVNANQIIRQGVYTFSISSTNYKKNE